MGRVTQDLGWLLELNAVSLGSALVEDAPIGATELVVGDVVDFDEAGGTLLLGGELLGYSATDPDAETIILNGPLAEAAAVDDYVAVWDDENGKAAAEIRALVEFINTNGDDDPVAATLTHALAPQLALGPRDGRGETVLLEEYGGSWRVVDVLGKDLVLDVTSGTASAPAPPTGLTLDAGVYVVGARNYARVLASWDPVTTRVNGDDLEDLDHYTVQTKNGLPEDGTFQWGNDVQVPAGTENVMMQPFNVGQTVSVRVRAVTENDIVGPWCDPTWILTSDDDEAPATPSTPTTSSRLGTVKIFWDGRNASGGLMDADFDYVEVHASTTPTFTPVPGDTGTVIGRLYGAGYHLMSVGPTGYNTTWYYRLIAIDTSGNASGPSGVANSIVKPLVDVSNFPDDAMEVLYARTGHFIDLTAANFSANLITADYIDFGTLYGELITGLQIQTDTGATTGVKIKNTGIEAYNSSGTRTFYVNASTGAVEILGSLTSGSSITGASITGSTLTGNTVQTASSGSRIVLSGVGGLVVTGGSGTTLEIGLSGQLRAYSQQAQFFAGLYAAGTSYLYDGVNVYNGLSVQSGGASITGSLGVSSSITASGALSAAGITSSDLNGGGNTPAEIGNGGLIKRGTSTRRVKSNIEPYLPDINAFMGLQPVTFTRNEDGPNGRTYVGFIAEDLAEAGLEELIYRGADGLPAGIYYAELSTVLLTIAKDLDRRVRTLEHAA